MEKTKNIIKIFLILLVIFIYTALIIDVYVSDFSSSKCTFQLSKIKRKKVGLLLGTSKILASGKENNYYKFRIEAAVELFNSGKIKFILISGDNSTVDYNEPQMMKNDLIKKNIPENKIVLDYAGFSTYESVYRCWKIFGEKDVIVISQKFHNQRSIFIAAKLGLNIQGYNAKDVNRFFGFKTNLREKFARTKLLFEVFFKPKPKFFGKRIIIK